MNDVMIDFETFGVGPHKIVCQVGAVYFDKMTGELGKEFFSNIDARSHESQGGVLEADTVYWWLKQSKEAQDSLSNNQRDIFSVFEELNCFLADAKRIWSHATFDFVTLLQTMKDLGIKPLFNYKSGMDLRTLVYIAGADVSKVRREGIWHNGLDDAKHQVKYCVSALNACKTNKKSTRLLCLILYPLQKD